MTVRRLGPCVDCGRELDSESRFVLPRGGPLRCAECYEVASPPRPPKTAPRYPVPSYPFVDRRRRLPVDRLPITVPRRS